MSQDNNFSYFNYFVFSIRITFFVNFIPTGQNTTPFRLCKDGSCLTETAATRNNT